MKVTVIPVIIDTHGTISKGLLKGLEDFEIRNGEYSDLTIIKIGYDTEKIPEDLRRLAVT